MIEDCLQKPDIFRQIASEIVRMPPQMKDTLLQRRRIDRTFDSGQAQFVEGAERW
jgi:hypothetical protein